MSSAALTRPLRLKQYVLCLLCFLWGCIDPVSGSVWISTTNSNDTGSSDHWVSLNQTECVAEVITHLTGSGTGKRELMCTLKSGISYPIPSVTSDWIMQKMATGELISGDTKILIPPDAMLHQLSHELYMTDSPNLWNYDHEERQQRRALRRLAVTGTKTVLVVRIAATDKTTTPSATDLGNHVFGDDGNDFNLKYTTEACSFNQMKINKASDRSGTGASISNGITTISVSISTSAGEATMRNTVTGALNSAFGVSAPNALADLVMYCLPPGTTDAGVIAYAIKNGFLSFYNDVACTYPSAQMHEIGHNYNMDHSSDPSDEYGDQSGLMGYSYLSSSLPKMCFNAAKSWQLGWYESKSVSITPSSSSATHSVTLAGVVDYSTTSNKVLLEIKQTNTLTYYYVNYNRQSGINLHTQEGGNQVRIVSKDTSQEGNMSIVQASLSSGSSYTISNFSGQSGETLKITFTSLSNNEATVDIVLTGFPVGPTNAPTKTPTKAPTKKPTPNPTSAPSKSPSKSPTKKPTPGPTSTSSSAPSKTPTKRPSQNPSSAPSKAPSKTPSTTPSSSPSVVPSNSPSATVASEVPTVSKEPSNRPSTSESPSTIPSRVPSMQPSSDPSTRPSNQPSMVPSSKPSNEPSIIPSTAPSLLPTVLDVSERPSNVASSSPSSFPSSLPSKQPTRLPSVAPSTSLAPSSNPSDPVSLTRIATLAVEISADAINNLEIICKGMESFFNESVQKTYGSGASTTIVCSKGQGRRFLNVESGLAKDQKPILVVITTVFPNEEQAPRQFGFSDFLEEVIVSGDAQKELPSHIQQAMGDSGSGTEEVHLKLVEDRKHHPILVVALGELPPTASPTVSQKSNNNGGTAVSASSRPRYPYMVTVVVGGIMATL